MKKLPILFGLVFVAIVLVMSSLFIVDERQKALVLQFGQIKAVKEEPGLGFKIPFIQNVEYFDDRILSLDTAAIEVTPSDDRRLVVDAFARFRISDVEAFKRNMPLGMSQARQELQGILLDRIRVVLGEDGVTSNTILSSDRAALMQKITVQSRARAQGFGIEVIDVRLKQTNLPEQNLDATFARMSAERAREAADERARGQEAAQRVRAQADRTVVELESDARRQAEITRGEADAAKNKIYADAYGADPEFFEFYRSLDAYRQGLKGSNTTMVLSPDSEFFDYLKSDVGR
ncbi:protease modulator HflC [Celeribacter sp. HF31]|uniref:protease modulator HflC n=1 Tax=Celeribacter sp. HF31 TaxID=2721558 RepID=UPI00143194BF|nr:protease modulator HflC [Celeribacter sp. HF31]NIY80215.1 protease modulator HflC [Celeribacter sp. HF31]